jgi:hypothetical protein
MGTKMTLSARAELTDAIRRRYSVATGAEKRKILDEFIAATGYHEKSAIRALNAEPTIRKRQTRLRPSLYDEAVRAALIVLWEASDRVCGKRLRALLPILLPALERNGHLHLADPMRQKILAMSASTIDRLLREPRSATRLKRARRAMPAARRRVPVRTFADWNEPPPGSMEMDCVAHCGDANRGSYVNSLVLTDIASGWTEAAPLVVRESGLLRALKSPLPSPNVMVPKQSFETRSPVLPSVEYSKMPPQLQPILVLHLNARHSCNCGPHSTVKGRQCSSQNLHG